MDKTSESTLEVSCVGGILLLRFITLGDIWDGRTREAGGNWGVLKRGVLRSGCGEIWPLVDGET